MRRSRGFRGETAIVTALLGVVFSFSVQAQDESALPAPVSRSVDFAREIQPIFSSRCLRCHGPGEAKNGYRLDQKAGALAGGDSGDPAIVPGKSAESPLVWYVSGLEQGLVMPPRGERLSNEGQELGPQRVTRKQLPGLPVAESEGTPSASVNHWSMLPSSKWRLDAQAASSEWIS